MAKIKIVKGIQSFSVYPIDIDLMDLLEDMDQVAREFSNYRLVKDPITKKIKREIDKIYFITDFRNNKLILINTYLKVFLAFYGPKYEIEIVEEKPYESISLKNVKINPKYKPRDYQKVYIDAIVNAKVPRILVDLYTGYGKSLIATISSVLRGKKFALLILPRYINKWIGDLLEYTNLKEDNIFVVKGSDSIRYLSEASDKELEKYQVFIFSLTTMRNYRDNYLDVNEEFKYPLKPEEFIRKLGIDSIVSDETHQEFHNIYSLTMLFNPNFLLSLTATLIPSNNKEKKIQEYFFPENYRLSGIIEYSKYIELYPIGYEVVNPSFLKSETKYGYSHTRFEEKIKKRKHTLNNYLELIYFCVGKFYLKYRRDGDKCLIFVSTVEMASIVRDYLRTKIPNLSINKYTAEDPYEIIEKSDIIISTLGSAGTALDIKNLITVIQTVLVKSPTANIQSLGRLRKLKDKKVRFVYIYAENIKKHLEYHKERLSLFRDRVSLTVNYKYSKAV